MDSQDLGGSHGSSTLSFSNNEAKLASTAIFRRLKKSDSSFQLCKLYWQKALLFSSLLFSAALLFCFFSPIRSAITSIGPPSVLKNKMDRKTNRLFRHNKTVEFGSGPAIPLSKILGHLIMNEKKKKKTLGQFCPFRTKGHNQFIS